MLLSQKHNFIFIHNHKTAGMSLEAKLTAEVKDIVFWQDRHERAVNGIEQIGLEEWSKYFSFAFVRNPWDRLVSWYAMIQKKKGLLPANYPRNPFPNALWNYALHYSHDFETFIVNCTHAVNDRGCIKSFAFNQIDYLTDSKGVLRVNFIGFYEELEQGLRFLANKLDLSQHALPRMNTSSHAHYSHWYTPKLRDIVAERFARDIKAFNYCFEERVST